MDSSGDFGSSGAGGARDDGILAAGSEAIEIRGFSHWTGAFGFERRLTQLSPKQLALAEAIKVVPSTGGCWEDAIARVVGIDNSERRLETARRLVGEHGLEMTLLHGNAEQVPYPNASFDFAISEYGAAIWCDPRASEAVLHRARRWPAEHVWKLRRI